MAFADEAKPDPTLVRHPGFIMQQQGLSFAIHYQHVYPSVIVIIADCQSTPDNAGQSAESGAFGGIFKSGMRFASIV